MSPRYTRLLPLARPGSAGPAEGEAIFSGRGAAPGRVPGAFLRLRAVAPLRNPRGGALARVAGAEAGRGGGEPQRSRRPPPPPTPPSPPRRALLSWLGVRRGCHRPAPAPQLRGPACRAPPRADAVREGGAARSNMRPLSCPSDYFLQAKMCAWDWAILFWWFFFTVWSSL